MGKRLLFIFIILSQVAFGQEINRSEKRNHMMITGGYHQGDVLATNPFVAGENMAGQAITQYRALSFKIGWQNPAYTDWQKIYHSPYYGIGYYYGDYFNQAEIGNPMSVYGYMGIPVLRFLDYSLFTEMQYGVAWNWHHYDAETNPYNLAIGGSMTVHVDVGLKMFYSVNERVALGFGYSFTHFSNGGMERPNRGLNMTGASFDLQYRFHDRPEYKQTAKIHKDKTKYSDFDIMLGYSNHQMVEHELDTNYFSVMGLGLYHSVPFGNAYRSGIGVDFNYLMSLSANPDGTMGEKGSWDNLTVGLIYAPEIEISRLSIVTGIGIYAKHARYGNFKQTYQRATIKYHFTDHLSCGVGVRAINFMLAEFLEFNFGYRIKWERSW